MNAMMGMKRITIAQYERGLLFRNRSFEAVMEPGVHWMFDPLNRSEIKVYDVTVAEFEHSRIDVLITEARALIERHLMIVELGDREVGLVYKNGRLESVLPPGKRQLYWRGPITVRVDVKDISRELLTIDMSKQQQSSDWGADALSDAQLAYAASDVLYLHALRDKLDAMLAREGRDGLVRAALGYLPDRVRLDLAGFEAMDIFSHASP